MKIAAFLKKYDVLYFARLKGHLTGGGHTYAKTVTFSDETRFFVEGPCCIIMHAY